MNGYVVSTIRTGAGSYPEIVFASWGSSARQISLPYTDRNWEFRLDVLWTSLSGCARFALHFTSYYNNTGCGLAFFGGLTLDKAAVLSNIKVFHKSDYTKKIYFQGGHNYWHITVYPRAGYDPALPEQFTIDDIPIEAVNWDTTPSGYTQVTPIN